MRLIIISIDCDDICCFNCEFKKAESNALSGYRCSLFKRQLRSLNWGKPLRLEECGKAGVRRE